MGTTFFFVFGPLSGGKMSSRASRPDPCHGALAGSHDTSRELMVAGWSTEQHRCFAVPGVRETVCVCTCVRLALQGGSDGCVPQNKVSPITVFSRA